MSTIKAIARRSAGSIADMHKGFRTSNLLGNAGATT